MAAPRRRRLAAAADVSRAASRLATGVDLFRAEAFVRGRLNPNKKALLVQGRESASCDAVAADLAAEFLSILADDLAEAMPRPGEEGELEKYRRLRELVRAAPQPEGVRWQ